MDIHSSGRKFVSIQAVPQSNMDLVVAVRNGILNQELSFIMVFDMNMTIVLPEQYIPISSNTFSAIEFVA